MSDKHFVAVRCRYYKSLEAKAILDHADAKRIGFTNSNNVHWEHSMHNTGYYYHGAKSCAEALELMMKKHKMVTGKKFESIITFCLNTSCALVKIAMHYLNHNTEQKK